MPPRKILAVKLRALGDTLLMTAPLAELRRAYPSAEIHIAVNRKWAPLLEGHPAVDRLWLYDRHEEKTARARALTRLGFALRRERFDLALNFHASPSSAVLTFASGARIRSIHFHGHQDRNLYSTVEVPGKATLKPIIERDMDTVRALGLHVPAGRLPKIYLREAELRDADARLAQAGLGTPLLALGIGASRPTKVWPLDRFARLAVEWVRQSPTASVLVAVGPDEEASQREFLKHLDEALASEASDASGAEARTTWRRRILSERGLPLRALAALLARASVFCGNDSGPKHLAAAVGTPTVTLFGPEDPFEWHPYPASEHIALTLPDIACRKDAQPGYPPWCGLETCTVEKHRCMRDIGVNPTYEACRSLVRKVAP